MELLTQSQTGKYENLVLKEQGKWKILTNYGDNGGFIPELGRCGFCGHPSKSGWMIQSEDNRQLMVGTDCVCVLCNLDKKQQKIIKYSANRYAIRRKYSKVLQFLQENHGNDIIKAFSIIAEDDICILYENNLSGERNSILKKYWNDYHYDSMTICKTPEWSVSWVAWNIIEKINNTIGINKFWFNKYKELTNIDLLGMRIMESVTTGNTSVEQAEELLFKQLCRRNKK